ncbi:geranylgeranyl reductase family protein [Candidatus Eisenbacteria bacterium]|uniref:Geranylgeranyl reductase family protein n=1 Tax=Eiseniibacteriota bacterium TaxID=2212470 RepID=A0ABV6YNW0_UNCEI
MGPLRDFDVIVVGGGCAGLWAAIASARNKGRTLLVERSSRIGEKIICAEAAGLPGLRQFVEPREEWISTGVERAALFNPEGRSVGIGEPEAGYVLDKRAFLAGLAETAREEGVEILTASNAGMVCSLEKGGFEIEVTGTGGARRLTCGAVVGADGIESRVGRQMGILKGLKPLEVFSCAQYSVDGIDTTPGTVEFYFGRDIAPGGYAWVFPKGESSANVGLGITYTSKPRPTPFDYLETFKEKRCAGAEIKGRLCGGVPSRRSPDKAYGKGVFLAGDSAGAADPVSGAGIVPGMESGDIAGRAASTYALGSTLKEAEKGYRAGGKAVFGDRGLRMAVRKILTRMSDQELVKMLDLTGEYASQDQLLHGDPFKLVKFFVKSMPRTFGLVRHLVGA